MKYSLLIVNYKTKNDVLLLLNDISSCFQNLEYEVIVVDNNSGDLFPCNLNYTTVIYNSENSGFGKAMNIAANKAKGEYLVLINPDCRIPLNQNFDAFVEDAKKFQFGALAPLVEYPDGSIQPNRGSRSTTASFIFQTLKLGRFKSFVPTWFGTLPIIRNTIVGKYLKNFRPLIPTYEICDWVTGAFMVIPKELYSNVHGFDENYFMYSEDEDICIELQKSGGKSVFSSRFKVVHEVGGSQKTGEDERLKFTVLKRLESSIYFLSKHSRSFNTYVLKLFYVLLYFILMLKFTSPGKYFDAAISFFKYKPPQNRKISKVKNETPIQ